MSDYRVAYRYAKSLIELAHEKGILEQVKDDMALFQETVAESRDFAMMLKSPIINHYKKGKIIEKLFTGKVQEMTSMFFVLICHKSREAILEAVAAAFMEQYNTIKGIQRAHVVSATELTGDLRSKIENVVKGIAGMSDVTLTESIDETLIGGYVLTVGDRQIDDSVKGRLENLRTELQS